MATIYGTEGDDNLTTPPNQPGSSGVSIDALGGNDIVNVHYTSSSNEIDGGAGEDLLIVDLRGWVFFSAHYINLEQAGAFDPLDPNPNGLNLYFAFNFERLIAYAGGTPTAITGGALGDTLYGGTANDTIIGMAGNDFIDGGAGADDMDGGMGDDIVFVSEAGDIAREQAGQGNDEVRTSLSSYTLAANFEMLTGIAAGFQTLIGNGGANLIDGGNAGASMQGGAGDDVYIVDRLSDTIVESAAGGTDTVRTILGNRAEPSPVIYVLPANVENLTGTLGNAQSLQGNALNNVITTTAGADFLYAQDGGNDILSSGGGNDFLYFGAAFDNNDTVNGGNGVDRLALYGNYALTFAAGALTGIERLMLYSEAGTVSNYNLTTIDANVAAGAQLEVAALSLDAGDTLTFNGSAEINGSFWIRSGDGNDVLTGGAMADRFVGGLGGDRMTGNNGADRFDTTVVAHSTGINFDTLVGFDTNVDRINITGAPASWATAVSGALSNANFDAELAALVNNNLGANQAIRVDVTSGDHASKNFIVFDANGDGSYTAGADYVFAFEGAVGPIFENAGIFI